MKTIIMAGGSGTRLWPLSRSRYPKQFLKLKGFSKSFFQMTIERCLIFCGLEDIYVVTNKDYKFIIANQLEEMNLYAERVKVLLEPMAKNTLPAIYNGVREIRKEGDDIVVVLPSDHLMEKPEKFAEAVHSLAATGDDFIYTFGIKPTFPETGFGYINPGEALSVGNKVKEFKEKPDLETAKEYMEQGYLWNSGMFMFSSALFVSEVRIHEPAVDRAFANEDVEKAFAESPNISIDYGLIEKSDKVAVLPIDVDWDDLGSFATFYKQYEGKKDADGNVNFSDNIVINSSENMMYTSDRKMCALVGIKDLIVIDQEDALLICHKDSTQDVKEVVDELKRRGDARSELHLKEYRPWGSFTILEEGDFYKIKRLTVIPGKQLSYQMHHHRSEHWIVVQGTATVTLNDEDRLVKAGESIFVSIGDKHKLANKGKLMLEVIEVQSGQYLGEDDIIRFNDDFGRC